MKLYYFKDPHGNFGDDLNPWLWDRLLPMVLDDDRREIFVGIGTLLNHRLPAEPVKHVFGSGVGYGELPQVDGKFIFHAVRGFESARLLGLDSRCVITDAAVLLRAVYRSKATRKEKRMGFIPHALSTRYFDWESVCREMNLHYISPTWNVDRFLGELERCETVLCEAMHGAIAADTLRIPWIPVYCYDYISEFKWTDWLSTLNLAYTPSRVTSLYDVERGAQMAVRLKNGVKRTLKSIGLWSEAWTSPPPARTGMAERERAMVELQAASRRAPYLSADHIVESHTNRYLDLIEQFSRFRARTPTCPVDAN